METVFDQFAGPKHKEFVWINDFNPTNKLTDFDQLRTLKKKKKRQSISFKVYLNLFNFHTVSSFQQSHSIRCSMQKRKKKKGFQT